MIKLMYQHPTTTAILLLAATLLPVLALTAEGGLLSIWGL